MPNFHFLVPLLGLSEVVYRSLIWATHLPTLPEDFIGRIWSCRQHAICLSMLLDMSGKLAVQPSCCRYGKCYQNINVKTQRTIKSPFTPQNLSGFGISVGEPSFFLANHRRIYRQEFFAYCYKAGITN